MGKKNKGVLTHPHIKVSKSERATIHFKQFLRLHSGVQFANKEHAQRAYQEWIQSNFFSKTASEEGSTPSMLTEEQVIETTVSPIVPAPAA